MWLSPLILVMVIGAASCKLAPGGGQEGQVITFRKKDDPDRVAERLSMVESQIERRGVLDKRVLEAMRKVPRHLFVPQDRQDEAYGDFPLPIGHGQTISQPYIVALMTELLEPEKTGKVLEIGTGSGYQTAVLAELFGMVYSIEIVEPLARTAQERLAGMGYRNVEVKAGDGFFGWPGHAPFDGIIVTAAPEKVPQPLLDQLAENGCLVIPEGKYLQDLVVYKKEKGKVKRKNIIPVRFVPMTGEAEKR